MLSRRSASTRTDDAGSGRRRSDRGRRVIRARFGVQPLYVLHQVRLSLRLQLTVRALDVL